MVPTRKTSLTISWASPALLAAALFFVVACASSPDVRWAQAQVAYNSTLATMIDLRRPCVDIGPEDPGCIIDDDEYGPIEAGRRLARMALDDYDRTGSIEALNFVELSIAEWIRLTEEAR